MVEGMIAQLLETRGQDDLGNRSSAEGHLTDRPQPLVEFDALDPASRKRLLGDLAHDLGQHDLIGLGPDLGKHAVLHTHREDRHRKRRLTVSDLNGQLQLPGRTLGRKALHLCRRNLHGLLLIILIASHHLEPRQIERFAKTIDKFVGLTAYTQAHRTGIRRNARFLIKSLETDLRALRPSDLDGPSDGPEVIVVSGPLQHGKGHITLLRTRKPAVHTHRILHHAVRPCSQGLERRSKGILLQGLAAGLVVDPNFGARDGSAVGQEDRNTHGRILARVRPLFLFTCHECKRQSRHHGQNKFQFHLFPNN